jgi:hypothetical protein
MLRKIPAVSFVLIFPALAAAAEVRVDYDRHQDFTKYRSFAVEVAPLVRADGVVDEHNTLAVDRLHGALARELQARGLEPAGDGADLTVRVSGRETERTAVVPTGWSHPWSWRRRWGLSPYGYWGGPYYGDVLTRRYIEGSLTVDVVDRDTGALVYRAQVTDEVGKDLDEQVAKSIDKAFKKFPLKERSD